jgi:hypothetical protein
VPENAKEKPWAAGWAAARANLVPGLLVQGLMLGVLIAYFLHPPTTVRLDQLAGIKQSWGYAYSAVSAIIAGAFIPEGMRILFFQSGRWMRRNASNLFFSIPFWCFMGVVVDAFYRLQAVWFGSGPQLAVILPKVIVDQFVYNPLFAAPFTAVLYDLKQSGYRFRMVAGRLSWNYYREVVIPTLVATWGVWIPVVSILYALPGPLQIPLFGLALSLWVMIYTWMSETRARAHQPSQL